MLPTESDPITAIDLPALVQQFAPGGRLLRAWALQGGISAEMTALELEQADGHVCRWVLRRATSPNSAAAIVSEYNLLRQLEPLGLLTPSPRGFVQPGPAILLDYIEGQPDFATADRLDSAQQMAAHLARIHQVHADWDWLPQPAALLAEPARPPAANAALPTEAIRTAILPGHFTAYPNPPALLHGDYWPGNILWRGGQLSGVIDWEDAQRSDPLADLAISRLDIRCIYGAAAMRAFTRRYQSLAPLDYRALPAWDLLAALRLARLVGADLENWAAFFQPYPSTHISASSLRAAFHSFTRAALAQLSLCKIKMFGAVGRPKTS